MATLTRATLGKIAQRASKTIQIDGNDVKIQRPTPLEFSQYQIGLISKEGAVDPTRFADAILLLVARMWIDEDGKRLFADNETKDLGAIDLSFYHQLYAECQRYAMPEAKKVLGESVQIPVSDLLVESASSLE
jgi:hypothetical protein